MLKKEIDNAYLVFRDDWRAGLAATCDRLLSNEEDLKRSYRRLTTLQGWRSYIIESQTSEGSAAFFLEAQNDALVSHVQASCGSWRVALKALRSSIENALMTLYYKDHPIELEQWGIGKFKMNFSDLMTYVEGHPRLRNLPETLTGIALLRNEYGALSKAVHASSSEFRVTSQGKAIALWSMERSKFSSWITHEKRTLEGVNLLLLVMFSDLLKGTKQPALRESIGFAIPDRKDTDIREKLGVTLKR